MMLLNTLHGFSGKNLILPFPQLLFKQNQEMLKFFFLVFPDLDWKDLSLDSIGVLTSADTHQIMDCLLDVLLDQPVFEVFASSKHFLVWGSFGLDPVAGLVYLEFELVFLHAYLMIILQAEHDQYCNCMGTYQFGCPKLAQILEQTGFKYKHNCALLSFIGNYQIYRFAFIIFMDQTYITFSKLLKDLQEPKQTPIQEAGDLFVYEIASAGAKFQSLDYHSSKVTLSGRQTGSYSWQQCLQNNLITSSSQLNKIYSTLNRKIIQFKYSTPNMNMDNQVAQDQAKEDYLSLKSQTFHRRYLPQSSFNEDFGSSKWGFDSNELHLFAKELSQFQQRLAPLVQNISQQKRWFLKIQGLYLLHQLTSLLRQISIAAYPFGPQDKVIYIIDAEITISTLEQANVNIIINKATNQLRLLDLKKADQFGQFCSSRVYLTRALQILQGKIREADKGLSQQDRFLQANSTSDLTSQDGYTNFTHSPQELKAFVLYFRLVDFTAQAANQLDDFERVIALDPLRNYEQEGLAQLLPILRQSTRSTYDYQLVYYGLINRIKRNDEEVSERFVESCYWLIEKSLEISQNDTACLIHYENLFELIKIAKNSKFSKASSIKKDIQKKFKTYLQLLRKRMEREILSLRIEMERVDQNITYQLLTKRKLLQHFPAYQGQINASLKKMIPIMLMEQKIKKLRELFDQDKLSFEDLLASFEYLSLLNQRSLRILERKLPKSRYEYDNVMDKIIDICENNPELTKRIPHLLQLRNILILVEVLKTPRRKTNKNRQNAYIDFKYLQQVADYFSLDRSQCKIYQLKSKILLFVILFKMGHYIPKIIENRAVVSLRQRIINLMIKQAKEGYRQSHLTPSVIRKGNVASSIYVYNHEEITISRISRIMEEGRDASIEIKASEELKQKIGGHIDDLSSKQDADWVGYITQRLNLMEHELFVSQRDAIKREEEYLCSQYLQHIENTLREAKRYKDINEGQFNTFLRIERYFFQQKYERGWQLLHEQSSRNRNFELFLDKVLESANNEVESYKFLKIYQQIGKIQSYAKPLLTQQSIQPAQIRKIMDVINQNAMFPLNQEEVIAVLNYMRMHLVSESHEESFLELDLSQNSIIQPPSREELPRPKFEELPRPPELSYTRPKQRLVDFNEVSIAHNDVNTTLVRIANGGRRLGSEIQDYLRIFSQLSSKGIAKVKSISYQSSGPGRSEKDIIIEIEDNSYQIRHFEMGQKQDVFQEKLTKVLLDRIVQIMRLFLMKIGFIDFGFDVASQIKIDVKSRTISINPCLIALEKILSKDTRKQYAGNMTQSIQRVVEPFRYKFTKHFEYNYSVLLKTLKSIRSFSLENLSLIFDSSLMLTPLQQAQLIINFEEKMAQNYRSFEGLAKLPKDSPFLLKKRMELMADPKLKNYTYYFKLGSVLQQQILEQEICTIYPKPPTVKSNFIWYDQKATEDNLFNLVQLKQKKSLRYTLQELVKRLKKALLEPNKEVIMQKINQRFPKLLHFIRRNDKLMDLNYEKVIADKNAWLASIFSTPETVASIKEKILTQNQAQSQKILKYQSYFRQNIYNKIGEHRQKYMRCPKCISIFQTVLKIPPNEPLTLIQFLAQASRQLPKNSKRQYTSEGMLSDEHIAFNCFLSERLASHPAVVTLGDEMKRALPKYYVVVNWWFWLEYSFPWLVEVLSQVQHQISLQHLDLL